MRRPPPVHVFQPDHTSGQLIGPGPADLGPHRYKQIQQILIGGLIIGIVAFMLLNGYTKARRPAYMADCAGRQRMLAQAFEMYAMDHSQYLPPAPQWRYAVSECLDTVGGTALLGASRRRGFSSPMRCLANQMTVPISYFYADPNELDPGSRLGDHPDAPVLVDEVHHPKAMILRQDGSCGRLAPADWLTERQDTWALARRTDWRQTFAYTSTRTGPTAGVTTGGGG